MRTRRRSDDLIIIQILNICENGARKTKIVYQANLNSTTVNRYLDILIKNGMITRSQSGSNVVFKTTAEGIELRNKLNHLQSEMDKLRTSIFDIPA